MYMVNLTDTGGFTRPLWSSGPDFVMVFNTVEDAIEAANRYLKVQSSVPSDERPTGYSWERFPQTGPMAIAPAISAIGQVSLNTNLGKLSWKAVVFKLGERKTT